jgi:hypothetical protein
MGQSGMIAMSNVGNILPLKRRRNGLPIVVASKSRIGRIRRAVKREFVVGDNAPIVIGSVLRRAYPRLSRFTSWHYLAARRALRQEAIVIARNRFGRGRPCLWVPVRCQSSSD